MTKPVSYVPTTKEWKEHCKYLLSIIDRIATDDEQVSEAKAHITTGHNRGIIERHHHIRELIERDYGIKGIRKAI